jgi:hypothetical protein
MGLFDRNDGKPIHAEFKDLVLDGDVLRTPVGAMPVRDLTRAEFLRTIVSDGPGPKETSVPAVVGGAVVGGAVFGAAGAVLGGLAGSTLKEDGPEMLRTSATQLIFETDSLHYSLDIVRADEGAAYTFSEAVKKAMAHSTK